jgi:NAD(P)-dependent dehydrogenase (short-subunit alcohol dehydrogenase family)
MLSAPLGSLDAFVLYASYNVLTPFDRINVEEWDAVLEVNLSGAFFALQALVPLVRPAVPSSPLPASPPTPGHPTICTTRPPRQDS